MIESLVLVFSQARCFSVAVWLEILSTFRLKAEMASKHCFNDAPSLKPLLSEAFKSSKVVCLGGMSDTRCS